MNGEQDSQVWIPGYEDGPSVPGEGLLERGGCQVVEGEPTSGG
ncbi:hypothetical protein ACFY4B_16025 [Kitasatospora sp. NPDC001261]